MVKVLTWLPCDFPDPIFFSLGSYTAKHRVPESLKFHKLLFAWKFTPAVKYYKLSSIISLKAFYPELKN